MKSMLIAVIHPHPTLPRPTPPHPQPSPREGQTLTMQLKQVSNSLACLSFPGYKPRLAYLIYALPPAGNMHEDFNSVPRPHLKVPGGHGGTLGIPWLETQRQVDPWGSLASQSGLLYKFQGNETWDCRLASLHMGTRVLVWTCISTHTLNKRGSFSR